MGAIVSSNVTCRCSIFLNFDRIILTLIDYTLGTASVVVAGLLASERLTGKKLKEGSYLFFGAGEVCMYVIMYVCILTVL